MANVYNGVILTKVVDRLDRVPTLKRSFLSKDIFRTLN